MQPRWSLVIESLKHLLELTGVEQTDVDAGEPVPSTFGPVSASATVGSVTVTATAKVSQIVWAMGDGRWAMGDGATVTWYGLGTPCTPCTPCTPDQGQNMSPDCGHRHQRAAFDKPDGHYRGTATATWSMAWTAPAPAPAFGDEGESTEPRATGWTPRIGELRFSTPTDPGAVSSTHRRRSGARDHAVRPPLTTATRPCTTPTGYSPWKPTTPERALTLSGGPVGVVHEIQQHLSSVWGGTRTMLWSMFTRWGSGSTSLELRPGRL